MLKTELIKQLHKAKKAYSELSWNKDQVTNNLQTSANKIKSLEREKESILKEANDRVDFIRRILEILSGEAHSLSKYEVIRDLFLPQLTILKKDKEAMGNQPRYIRPFLSDRINMNSRGDLF